MEERHFYKNCTLQPATLLKVLLLYGCFSRFLIVQMVPNRAKRQTQFCVISTKILSAPAKGVFLLVELQLCKL